MPPGAEWSWLEAYGLLQADPAWVHGKDWPAAYRAVQESLEQRLPRRRLDEELARAGFEKRDARYCNFIFHPLHELHAGMSLAINRRLSALEHVPFAHWLGTQYIVAALKPA